MCNFINNILICLPAEEILTLKFVMPKEIPYRLLRKKKRKENKEKNKKISIFEEISPVL